MKQNKDKHILDYIKFDVAESAVHRALKDISDARAAMDPTAYDSHVCQLYRESDAKAQSSTTWKTVLDALRADLRSLERSWRVSSGQDMGFKEKVTSHYEQWVRIAPPVRVRSVSVVKQLKGLHHRFIAPDVDYYQTLDDDDWTATFSQWNLLKASTTFYMLHKTGQDFTWYMAGKQILMLKASVMSAKPEYSGSSATLVASHMMSSLKADSRTITRLLTSKKAAADAACRDNLDEINDWDEVGTVIDDC
jgi:hypothetical protein